MKNLQQIECFLLDMDGTIYLGDQLIPGALEFIQKLEEQKKRYIFLTNNSSKNSQDYQAKLLRLGLNVSLDQIVNSGEVAADTIRNWNPQAVVYVVGTPSLETELRNAGLVLTTEPVGVDYLLLGFDTTLIYKKLWDAHELLLQGVEYLATNPDYLCPLAGGKTMPDCGAIISLLKTSSGREPLVIGKPNTMMIDYAVRRTGIPKERMAMVGDRLYTDIQTGLNAGITSVLVLSGETQVADLEDAPQTPTFVFDSIRELGEVL